MEKIISLENINKINCILGKSGCGKTTLLNIISGVIENDKTNFKGLEDLGISYIFQEDRLIDWLTVEDNIKLVVKKHFNEEKINNLCEIYLTNKNNFPLHIKAIILQFLTQICYLNNLLLK